MYDQLYILWEVSEAESTYGETALILTPLQCQHIFDLGADSCTVMDYDAHSGL